MKALLHLEEKANQYELALQKVMDAVDLDDAKDFARRAIREAYFGYLEDER